MFNNLQQSVMLMLEIIFYMFETLAEHLGFLINTKNIKIIPDMKCPKTYSTSVYYSERKIYLHLTPFFAAI